MKKNKDKIILDLCGGTGAWSEPYRKAGYDVRVITLPWYDVKSTSFSSDMLIFKTADRKDGLYIPYELVYGILAAPPCTEFSLAKSTKPRDFNKGMQIVRKCLEIIWHCRARGNLKWWALENPRGFLRQFLGKPAFTFEHWEFDDKGIKPTDLWGYFNEPKRKVKVKPEGLSRVYPCGKRNALGWSKSAEERAITPAGFAKAFFEANK